MKNLSSCCIECARTLCFAVLLFSSVNSITSIISINVVNAQERGAAWKRHTIDDSSRGADGVRLRDLNKDGLLDIVTGWEEGARIRLYLHPGNAASKTKWPAVTVGKVRSPEDAVAVDLDSDGAIDVVSSCEGSERSLFFHWAPRDPKQYLTEEAWKTEAVPVARKKQRWMYCVPLQVDGKRGVDLVVGSKSPDATIGWLESPEDPRRLSDWKWHPLYQAGWIMTITTFDVDGDGDADIVASDRKGKNRGCLWLENPGAKSAGTTVWKEHRIGPTNKEVMFLVIRDLDQDGLKDLLVATRGQELLWLRRKSKTSVGLGNSLDCSPA